MISNSSLQGVIQDSRPFLGVIEVGGPGRETKQKVTGLGKFKQPGQTCQGGISPDKGV